MQDNSTDNTTEMLIKYMDGELSEAEKTATEKLLQEDAALQERYQYFLAAKRAVRLQGIKQRVQAIHQEYVQETPVKQTGAAKKVIPENVIKNFLRIAAVLIIVAGSYATIQFLTTTSQAVYNDNFVAYQLPVNRSNEQTHTIESLYNNGNYTAVISTFNGKSTKQQKDYFIASQAYLQMSNTQKAIETLRQVEILNANSSEKYFQQETDYYLMLAYIKSNNIDKAKQQYNKIISNKNHLYYNKASQISSTKWMMLKWKE